MDPIRRLSEFTEDWGYYTKRDGLKSSLSFILSDITKLPYRHLSFIILARPLHDPFPDWQPKIQLYIRPFVQTDLNLVRQIDRPSEARLCAHRLAQGHKGLIALHQGQPVGYAWGCTEVDPKLERVRLKLESGDVLCADVYTIPAFRGKGIQTSLTISRFKLFRDLGYCRAITYIERRNSPSLAVWQRKLGSQTIGRFDFIRFGWWYRVRYQ